MTEPTPPASTPDPSHTAAAEATPSSDWDASPHPQMQPVWDHVDHLVDRQEDFPDDLRIAFDAENLAGGAGAVVGPSPFVGFGVQDAIGGLVTLGRESLRNPRALLSAAPRTAAELVKIVAGQSIVSPDQKDKRFRDSAWQDQRLLRRIMQAYLFLGAEVEFVIGLIREGLAPTNSILTNPTAIKKAQETKGKSLVRGFGRLVRDVRQNHGMPAQVNREPFHVGINLAVTRGRVIYRTDALEILHYQPQSEQVGTRPMVIVPPQVNKYYALDLAPGRSMYEYLLQHGIQVFGISWRNPTAKERHWDFSTYAEATLDAIDVVREVSGSPDVNVMGGCAGGMMVAILAAMDAARDEQRIHSTTMLVTLLDSRTDAEILLFASPKTVNAAKKLSSKRGYLEGWRMAQVFAWLRPNELVWNYWVNNYLLGNEPPTFDILAWNADTTRLPEALHHQLLDIVIHNQLTKPGSLNILGNPIDISDITQDVYVVGGLTDHITPWHGCYSTTQMVSGDCRFVLCSSGHVQSLVAAPNHRGLGYYTNSTLSKDADDWFAGSERHDGSWWADWVEWLQPRSGELKDPPKTAGNENFPAMEEAPGTYIFT